MTRETPHERQARLAAEHSEALDDLTSDLLSRAREHYESDPTLIAKWALQSAYNDVMDEHDEELLNDAYDAAMKRLGEVRVRKVVSAGEPVWEAV